MIEPFLCCNIPLDNKNAHRALDDCITTYELLTKCNDKIKSENISLLSTTNSGVQLGRYVPPNEFYYDEESSFYQKECVITGTLKMPRSDAEKSIVNLGGVFKNNLTQNTDYLIVGTPNGFESNKIKRAKEFGTKTISGDEFLIIINKAMNKRNAVQERISELESGILNIHGNHIEVRGFMSSDRLNDYLNGINCFLSFGRYPIQPYKQEMSKNDAHFIVHENGNQIDQWEYTMLFKGAVNLKIQGVNIEKIIIIRKEIYGLKYQFIGDRKNLIFESIDSLKQYLNEQYDFERLNLQDVSVKLLSVG